jgi:hypothetical protein
MPFENLSSDNHAQIRQYLRFFRQKKDGILRDIDREFADIKSDKLDETMFTREDMLEYSDFIASAIQVRAEGQRSLLCFMLYAVPRCAHITEDSSCACLSSLYALCLLNSYHVHHTPYTAHRTSHTTPYHPPTHTHTHTRPTCPTTSAASSTWVLWQSISCW